MDKSEEIKGNVEAENASDETNAAEYEVNEQVSEEEMSEPTQAEWHEALTKAVQQRDEYLQMAQRTQAEFSNYRRRTAQSRTDGYDDGVRETLSHLLPTIDTFERALSAAHEHGETGSMLEGIEMTHRQLMDSLSKLGLQEVPALGEAFDPELHNAVMRGEGEPGTVLEVFQKGYRVKDRIIRYAMVKVAAE